MKIVTSGELLLDIAKSAQALGREDILLTLKDDRLVTMVKGVENTTMFAARVPDKGMKEYDSGDKDEIALPVNKIVDFSPKKAEQITLEYEDHEFHLSNGQYTATFNAVNTDYVEGVMEQTIKTDWPIEVSAKKLKINDFINTAQSVVGEETFIVGGREDGLYLMSKLDDSELHTRIKWEDFEDINNDWAMLGDDLGEKKTDSVFSTDFFNSLHLPSDPPGGYTMNFGDNCPMRLIAKKTAGVELLYILTPRIKSGSTSRIMEIPDRVTDQYN